MGAITTAVTTLFRDAQRAIAEMRQSFEDDFLAESGEMPDRVHDVVRSLALGLVDDQGAVKGSGLRLAGHSQ